MENERDIIYSGMAGCIPNLNFSEMSQDECMQLAYHCEETRAGLCHCLNFIGDILVANLSRDKLELAPVNLIHLGHSLTAISSLLPALTDLEQIIRTELSEIKSLRL